MELAIHKFLAISFDRKFGVSLIKTEFRPVFCCFGYAQQFRRDQKTSGRFPEYFRISREWLILYQELITPELRPDFVKLYDSGFY